MNTNSNQSTFAILSAIDVTPYVEKKSNGLTYLSWSQAWRIVKENFPDATYEKRYWNEKPYLFDPDLGYYVETSVTINGETQTMNLFVMDGANKAMLNHPYEYQTKYGPKQVEQATMFDINTALQRCLVKNLAMFGLGLSLYYKETVPDHNADAAAQAQSAKQTRGRKAAQPQQQPAPQQPVDKYAGIKMAINGCADMQSLTNLYWSHQNEVEGNSEIKSLFTQRRLTLQAA